MGKYRFTGIRTAQVDEAIANELAEANRLKRIEISLHVNKIPHMRDALSVEESKYQEDQA